MTGAAARGNAEAGRSDQALVDIAAAPLWSGNGGGGDRVVAFLVVGLGVLVGEVSLQATRPLARQISRETTRSSDAWRSGQKLGWGATGVSPSMGSLRGAEPFALVVAGAGGMLCLETMPWLLSPRSRAPAAARLVISVKATEVVPETGDLSQAHQHS